ncbi:sigma-54-dependent transcriptional regulator [Saccharospirillum impatiens]|uniref:sigma-54-dependent transcriptional regulator n=1 Tax=Saccharospirillum impatiens TaxID=169438 RepID=UPI000411409A|nr:sigma-54 dependent transcriptional regulator [Saccharospirillum impatiens]
MRVLIVEDDASLREAVSDTLKLSDYEVIEADCGEAAIVRLNEAQVDFIVSDVNMPGMDGHELLAYVRQNQPQIPFLLVTAYATVEKAVSALHAGAVDYLVKPFQPEQLIELLERHGNQPNSAIDEPIANEVSSQQVLMLARKVAVTDSTTLISGESGTGKEVLARYIHQHSPRAQQPFVAINCAAIPENMLEATLFGHEKGAFTGAIASQPGKFEQANGGTLLLDEISEMDMGLQAKLLRVLQEREVERIGGRKVVELDVRVLATTNRDLMREVQAGRFREDLYYRLNVFPLQWQPLRARRGDLVPLANHLLAKHAKKMHKPRVALDDSARARILSYDWPGNIRELDNALQRALILQSGQWVTAQDLGLEGEHLIDFEPARQQALAQHAETMVPPFTADSDEPGEAGPAVHESMQVDLKHREFDIILDALRVTQGRKNRAADKLGISARTLRYKLARMREIGMDVDGAIAGIR